MNYKKLSELPVAEAISGEDTVPIVQGGSTKKAAIDKIIGSTTKEITVLKGEIDSVSDSVNALWELNEGISFDFVTDSVEANTKTVPNGGKYAAVEEIGGKTVVWNCLLDRTAFPKTNTKNGISWTNNSDGTITISGDATGHSDFCLGKDIAVIPEHKYILFVSVEPMTNLVTQVVKVKTSGEVENEIFESCKNIISFENTKSISIYIKRNTNNAVSGYAIPFLSDLTLLFGIGNEPTDTDDPQIAWIKQYVEVHPEYNAGELVSAKAENIKYKAATIGDIPAAVCNLTGYGWSVGSIHNSIERTENGWQYVQRVGSVDMGALTWSYYLLSNKKNMFFSININKAKGLYNLLTSAYVKFNQPDILKAGDKIIIGNADSTQIRIIDNAFTDAGSFKAAISGVPLYYELAEPIVTDITDLMVNFPKIFAVEAGGTITFDNDTGLSVPSEIKYVRKLSEVGA